MVFKWERGHGGCWSKGIHFWTNFIQFAKIYQVGWYGRICFWYWNKMKMKPTYRDKKLPDSFFAWRLTAKMRVPGLTIWDCAASHNNCDPGWFKLSAIDVIAKAIFERSYLVSGLRPFEPRVNCPYAPTPPTLNRCLFLDFCAIFFPSGPSFFSCTTRQVFWPNSGTHGLYTSARNKISQISQCKFQIREFHAERMEWGEDLGR